MKLVWLAYQVWVDVVDFYLTFSRLIRFFKPLNISSVSFQRSHDSIVDIQITQSSTCTLQPTLNDVNPPFTIIFVL